MTQWSRVPILTRTAVEYYITLSKLFMIVVLRPTQPSIPPGR